MEFYPRNLGSFNDIFDEFFPRAFKGNNIMKTDVYEKDGLYFLELELPGYKKEDIKMEISDGNLNISASTSETKEEKDEKGQLIRSERSFGSCARSFYVGDNITSEDVKARFENGVLYINLPSKETKRIQTAQQVNID